MGETEVIFCQIIELFLVRPSFFFGPCIWENVFGKLIYKHQGRSSKDVL